MKTSLLGTNMMPRLSSRAVLAALLVASFGCRKGDESSGAVGMRAEPLAPAPDEKHTAAQVGSSVPGASPVPIPVIEKAGDERARVSTSSLRVEGVAADDVLNIRAEPNAESPVMGAIPAGARHVEGLGAPNTIGQTSWQRVRYAGVVGWVSGRFLKVDTGGPPQPAAPDQIEALTPLVCFGDEPNWSLQFGADGSVTCGSGCEAPPGLRVTKVLTERDGTPDGFDLADARGQQWMRAVVSKTGQCSDGMSDSPYPFEITGVVKTGNLTGCCRVKEKAEP